jgi:NitT/TauT family transport system substrate-binding protein
MLRRRFLALAAAGGAALALPRFARAASTPVKIATGVTPPSIYNIWMHVAYDRGFFARYGFDVTDFIQLTSGPLAIQAIAARQVDIAPSDPEGLLAAAAAGIPVRAVAAPGSKPAYIVAVRKEVASVGDLAGKTFAISQPGAISQYLLFPLLAKANVPQTAVSWLAVGSNNNRLLALQAGRVQGALLNVDSAMQAANDPNIRLLQSIADVLPDYPVELLVLRREMIDANPDIALAATSAVIDACRFVVANRDATIATTLKYAPGSDPAILGRAYDELLRIHGFGVNGGMTMANLKIAHDLALQNGAIKSPVPVDQWADFRFQDQAVARLGKVAG